LTREVLKIQVIGRQCKRDSFLSSKEGSGFIFKYYIGYIPQGMETYTAESMCFYRHKSLQITVKVKLL